MKHLYYQGKFFKTVDDKTANEINIALISPKWPYHVLVDGETLKTSQIEVRAGNELTGQRFSFDYRNDEHRKAIRQFGAQLGQWYLRQPRERRIIEYHLAEKGAIRIVGEPRIRVGGVRWVGPDHILMRDGGLYADIMRKYTAYQDFLAYAFALGRLSF